MGERETARDAKRMIDTNIETEPQAPSTATEQKYIVRTVNAGVFYAGIAERRGGEADLLDARRIWRWEGATECIGIATDGVKPQSRLTVPAKAMTVLGVIEIHPVTEKAKETLDACSFWKA